MSDSEGSNLQIDLDRSQNSSPRLFNSKKRHSKGLLKPYNTEFEIKYRNSMKNSDFMKEYSDILKCTKCQYNFKDDILKGKKIYSHPVLDVLMCELCCEFYGNGEFSMDEDGEDKYCRWCGEGGKIFLCSECIYGFCPDCIKKNFGNEKLRKIAKDDEWKCFLCNPRPLWKLRAVCNLAKEEAKSNKIEIGSGENKPKITPKKTRAEHQTQLENLSDVEMTHNKGTYKNDSDQSSIKGKQKGKTEHIRRRRKRLRVSNGRDKSGRFAGGASNDTEEPPKKLQKMKLKGTSTKNERENGWQKNTSKFSSIYSSDSSEDENKANDASESNSLHENASPHSQRKINKNLDRLKDIFTVAETVSELCLTLCRKKIKKLDRNMMSEEKLLPECEKLRSMIILMSCSLSTVHNLITSLQQKCKKKENLATEFHGKQHSTLLEAIVRILWEKRIKTSHFFDIVTDILNRYPFIELGAKAFNNSLINSIKENTTKYCPSSTCQISLSNSVLRLDEKKEISEKEICKNAKAVITENKINPDFNVSQNDLEKTKCESDASTVMYESDSIHNSISNGELRNPHEEPNDGRNILQEGNFVSDASPDMEKIYLESLKLKKQLLTSSDDNCSDNEFSLINSNTEKAKEKYSKNSEFHRSLKAKTREQVREKSQDEKELNRLINVSNLDRSRWKKESVRNLDKKMGAADKDLNKLRCGRQSPGIISSYPDNSSSSSETENRFCDLKSYDKHSSGIQYVVENSSVVKNYFLETSSSNDSHDENSNSDEEPTKSKDFTQRSREVEKSRRENKGESKWKLDKLLRGSVSSSNSESSPDKRKHRSKPEKKRRKDNDSNKEGNANTDSSSSLNITPSSTKQKGTRVYVVSDCEDNSGIQPIPESKSDSSPKGRRNIKKILKTGNLQLETRLAVKMENDRKKRVAERNEIYEKLFPDMVKSDRLVLDFDNNTKEVLLEVPKELVKRLKPHQKRGIKFMWDCCFESVDSLDQSNGSGCVLAHCMGLGKTLQIVTLISTVLKHDIGVKSVLILCPLNVVSNWVYEFQLWLKDLDFEIDVYNLNTNKREYLRSTYLQKWQKDGGIMIVSYDLLRNLTNNKKRSAVAVAKANRFSKFLLDPGPDVVICDEGHLLKNQGTALWQCIMKIRTSRRIILTGTPLQNNLLEYHSMIQFIKPNILGTKTEFMNRFGNPIMNGQFEDSTARDVKLMRGRSHVLHKLLDGCVQRFNYSVLTPYLPEKLEYVISVRLTDTQAKLYRYYVNKCKESLASNRAAKLFSDYHLLHRIWTHPRVLAAFIEKRKSVLNGDVDENIADSSSSEDSVICLESEKNPVKSFKMNIMDSISPEEYDAIQSSGKLVLLFHILSRCKHIGDKVLVFSQSLGTLNLIEHFLRKMHSENQRADCNVPAEYRDTWEKGLDYYRMEGSTGYEARSEWCKSFNDKNNKRSRLFLISTKAGGLGINLVGANRVIIFDVSWNPSQDVQSIFRIYRFGQLKPCYIYRFVAEGTMEEKIYARQVTKLSLEKRVLDEHQIERHYTMGNLQELYKFDPMPRDKWTVPLVPKDMVLADILSNKDIIASYHEHDSLLENKEEEELTEEERKAAWEDFEKEKFMAEYKLGRATESFSTNFDNMNTLRDSVIQPIRPSTQILSTMPFRRPLEFRQHFNDIHTSYHNPYFSEPINISTHYSLDRARFEETSFIAAPQNSDLQISN